MDSTLGKKLEGMFDIKKIFNFLISEANKGLIKMGLTQQKAFSPVKNEKGEEVAQYGEFATKYGNVIEITLTPVSDKTFKVKLSHDHEQDAEEFGDAEGISLDDAWDALEDYCERNDLGNISEYYELDEEQFNDIESELGLKRKKADDIEEGGAKGKLLAYETSENQIIEVKLFSVEGHPNEYALRIQHDGKDSVESKQLVHRDKITDYIEAYMLQHDLEGSIEEGIDVYNNVKPKDDVFQSNAGGTTVKQSSKISVTLQKIVANNEETVNLCAVGTSSNPCDVTCMLDTVLECPEFFDSIGTEPCSYEICDLGEEYDVEPISDVVVDDTLFIILQECVQCYRTLQALHWGARGLQFADLHSLMGRLYDMVRYQEDTIAEWCVEYTKKVPNVLGGTYDVLPVCDGMCFEDALKYAKEALDRYINVLDVFYVNVDHDVQSVLDNWIRDMKKESDYIIDRMLAGDCK